MKRFFKSIFIFSFIVITSFFFIISIIIYRVGFNNLPALNFTDSYSYNEKIQFLKNKNVYPQIISIGSSMTLGNLDSQVVINHLNSNKYLNCSSWGLQMQETFLLLKLLDTIYDFNTVIITSNLIDFQDDTKNISYDYIYGYLTGKKLKTIYNFVRYFNRSYYLKNIKYANYVRNNKGHYEYLSYDDYGMTSLKRDSFFINEKRWVDNKLQYETSEISYSYLDSISNYCSHNKIELFFFHSPHREGLVKEFSLFEKRKLNNHMERVNHILCNKHHFVNSNNILWNDSLFVDGIHLDDDGAKIFTEFCFKQVNGSIN